MATDARGSNRRGRPNYPLEFKHRLAVAACEPGISVAKLSLAHGLNANMLFKWRRQYRAGQLRVAGAKGVVLIPVSAGVKRIEVEEVAVSASIAPSIEIEIGGATIRLHGVVDGLQLRTVLRCLGRAA